VLKIVNPPADLPGVKDLYQQLAEKVRFNPRAAIGV
jgi:hypothetical protein